MTDAHLRRRTFAIISHPDAGKTTLTEKLLFSGGAIHKAGEVKARGDARRARSDWMKIEQERGISVTSSVMTFETNGLFYNLLDTPGHEDFSEDTYRTLTAVDSAVMVIDAAKGIESQTLKLLEVCRLRDIPIMTFVNKVDREARDPFELLDEIHDTLQLDIAPIVWPVGMGVDFHGVYDFGTDTFQTSATRGGEFDTEIACSGIDDGEIAARVPSAVLDSVVENAELARGAYAEFNQTSYREGHLTPVVFGSALKRYGVTSLIRLIGDHAPPPRPSPATGRVIEPGEDKVTGFVFKVQANMDKNHRDRVAFMRVCSGAFRRGMKLKQVRSGKDVMVHSPITFFAQDREIAEDAAPGDVIGIPNHGTIRVGDTFTEGEDFRFTGLPVFAPEILRRVRLADTGKVKQLRAALDDLAEEGLIQVFKPQIGSNWIIGVIGVLQLDVLKSRALAEYRVEIDFEPVPYSTARWLRSGDQKALDTFLKGNQAAIVHDRDGQPVFMANSIYDLNYKVQNNGKIEFLKTKEIV
ncbi:MAG: peptide chain release factor 3 [Rhodobiaceae bacterium]|nr:peptide chain release factor 3 [Rhodobiaceae bacterium]